MLNPIVLKECHQNFTISRIISLLAVFAPTIVLSLRHSTTQLCYLYLPSPVTVCKVLSSTALRRDTRFFVYLYLIFLPCYRDLAHSIDTRQPDVENSTPARTEPIYPKTCLPGNRRLNHEFPNPQRSCCIAQREDCSPLRWLQKHCLGPPPGPVC
jgi:hypothetical protein